MPAGAASVPMGALSVSLIADIQKYSVNMKKALALLDQFSKKTSEISKKFAISFRGLGGDVTKSISEMTGKMSTMGTNVNRIEERLTKLGKSVRKGGQSLRDEADKTGETITRRGKQGLGAILSFSEGIKKFISLNVRWFVIWRSFWAVWGQLQKAVGEFRDILDETNLALRTGLKDLTSNNEQLAIGTEIQKEAIRATMEHNIIIKDYIKSWYYLTTAGISASNAFKFVNASITTAIALDEEHETTVRLLTGLYNVFGETLDKNLTPLEKFQKISAILTATFSKQDIELQDYAKSLPYVAAQWKLSGNSLEVLIASLGVMGTHFMRGSKSATSLGRSLSRMAKHVKRFADLTGKTFDPQQPLDFIAAFRELRKALRQGRSAFTRVGFSVAETNKLFDLFGIRGARASLLIVDKLEMIETQMIENYEATFKMTEAMAELTEETIPKQLGITLNILRGWVITFLLAATNTNELADSLKNLNLALKNITPVFSTFGNIVGKVVYGIRAYRLGIRELLPQIKLLDKFWGLFIKKAEIPPDIENWEDFSNKFKKNWDGMWGELVEATDAGVGKLEDIYERLFDSIMKMTLGEQEYELLEAAKHFADIEKEYKGHAEVMNLAREELRLKIAAINKKWNEKEEKEAQKQFEKERDAAIKEMREKLKDFVKRRDAYKKLLEKLRLLRMFDREREVEELRIKRIEDTKTIKEYFGEQWKTTKAALEAIQTINEVYADELAKLYEYKPLEKKLTEFQEFAKGTWESIGASIKDSMGDAFYEMIKATGDFRDIIGQIWQSLVDSILHQLARLAAEDVAGKIWGMMGGMTAAGVQATGRAVPSMEEGMYQNILGLKEQAERGPGLEEGMFRNIMGLKEQARIEGGGMGVLAPPPIVNITNIVVSDPGKIPAAMLQNKDVIVNLITENILNKGEVLSVMEGSLPMIA